MDIDDIELRVLKVELLAESYKTHRVQLGGDPESFPVRVAFTRRLNLYELAQLEPHGLTLEFPDPRDFMHAIVVTTAQFFGRVIDTINAELPGVAEDARQARAAAEEEDEHLAALVQQVNLKINPPQFGGD